MLIWKTSRLSLLLQEKIIDNKNWIIKKLTCKRRILFYRIFMEYMLVLKTLESTQKEQNLDFCSRWQIQHALQPFSLYPKCPRQMMKVIVTATIILSTHLGSKVIRGILLNLMLNKPYHLQTLHFKMIDP